MSDGQQHLLLILPNSVPMTQPASDWGVVYKPDNVGFAIDQRKVELDDGLLDRLGVRYIRLTWTDWTNVTRYQVLSRSYFRRLLRAARPGYGITAVAFGVVTMHICEGFPLTDEFLLATDQSSLRVCPYDPGYATVFGFFQNFVPDPQYGLEMLQCPRTQLVRMARLAEEKAGVTYLVGFESEFVLLKSTTPTLEAISHGEYAASAGLRLGSVEAKVIREIADALEDAGIEVEKFHGEASPGQVNI